MIAPPLERTRLLEQPNVLNVQLVRLVKTPIPPQGAVLASLERTRLLEQWSAVIAPLERTRRLLEQTHVYAMPYWIRIKGASNRVPIFR